MSFNPDLKKEAQEVTFSRKMTKSCHSQIFFDNALGVYLNEKLYFYSHRNVQINARNRCCEKAISKLFQYSVILTFVANAPSSVM